MANLSTIHKDTLEDIAYSLDKLRGNTEYWRLLIPLLPKELYHYNKVDVEKIARIGTKGQGDSPSLELLQDFQRKGMKLSYFIDLLKTIECQGALDCFKQPTKPVILGHPKSTTVVVNEKLELYCTAKCIPEPPDYQWFYYDTNLNAPVALKGAKNWKLIINKVTMKHTGHYCCRVQNKRHLSDDNYAVFSVYAVVIVKDKRAELERSGGSTNSFAPPVQEVSDQLHETLHIPHEEVADGRNTTAQLTHSTGSAELGGPQQQIKIVTQPKSQIVRLRSVEEKVMLECQAEPLGVEYKWYRYSGASNKPATLQGTGPRFTVTVRASRKLDVRYYCKVSFANQPESYVASDIAILKQEYAWFIEQPKEKYVAVTGKFASVSCRAEAMPGSTVKYQWFKCKQDGTGRQLCGYNENEMILPAIIDNRGYYTCCIVAVKSDVSYGDMIYSNVTHVEVANPVDITFEVQPPTDRYMELNETLVIDCKAKCEQHPVRYQWYRNGEELPDCTNSTLIIKSVSNHHMGSYYCEASSDYSAGPVASRTCRVHWKATNTSLLTTNRQQLDAEEVMIIDNTVYATDKMALLIGNCDYKGKPLKCSRNDVEAVTQKLRQLNFKTISLVNLTLSQMAKAVDYFCSLLDHGMYAVFYYSGHGLENQFNKTYLMPIDAKEPVEFDQCMIIDDIAMKMQAKKSKVVMILDCCRKNVQVAASVQPPSVLYSIDQSRGFSNLCQLFACAPSFEAYESKDGQYSYMTQAFLEEVDKPCTMSEVFQSVIKNYKGVTASGKVSPRPQMLAQMAALYEISFHDPILNEQELKDKELLLGVLPSDCSLEFKNAELRNMCDKVELTFSAKFSNVLTVGVTCHTSLEPEMTLGELKVELECSIQNEGDRTITSFQVYLLDIIRDKTYKLQISFQMPEDSSAKEILDYDIPPGIIKPSFYRH